MTKKGFTLIELLIAIAIIGMMMAIIIPMFQQQPGAARKKFIAQLNLLVQNAWQQSIITRAVHRIIFNFKDRQALVERNITLSPDAKKFDFKEVQGSDMQLSWPSSLIIRQFLVEGFDEMKRFSNREAEIIWFYIVPDGMTQQVTINGIDKEDSIENKPRQFGLVLNPFLAQFKEYDTFQK